MNKNYIIKEIWEEVEYIKKINKYDEALTKIELELNILEEIKEDFDFFDIDTDKETALKIIEEEQDKILIKNKLKNF